MSLNGAAWFAVWLSTVVAFGFACSLYAYWWQQCRKIDAIFAEADVALRAAWALVPEAERAALRRKHPATVAHLEQRVH